MLSSIFTAFRRLAASLNRHADLWDQASDRLESRLAIPDDDEPAALPVENGRRLTKARQA